MIEREYDPPSAKVTKRWGLMLTAVPSERDGDKGVFLGMLDATDSVSVRLTKNEAAILGYALLDMAGEEY